MFVLSSFGSVLFFKNHTVPTSKISLGSHKTPQTQHHLKPKLFVPILQNQSILFLCLTHQKEKLFSFFLEDNPIINFRTQIRNLSHPWFPVFPHCSCHQSLPVLPLRYIAQVYFSPFNSHYHRCLVFSTHTAIARVSASNLANSHSFSILLP